MRYKLTIEYDGTRYAGWQLQKNERTIQGELLEAAFKAFETRQIEIYGAGRTDAGVHARGQVAHLEVPGREQPEHIKMWLNDLLPHNINVLTVEPANPRFHARHDARSRTYVYQISRRRDAFAKHFTWWVKFPLNLTLMQQAADELVGFHDFRSFGEVEKEDQSTKVEMQFIKIKEDGDRIYITLKGSHFLWKMVRRIVGVLVEVGRGRMTVDTVSSYLQTPSREPSKLTAPPSGLFLERIDY